MMRFQLGEYEPIDRFIGPLGVPNRGDLWRDDRLQAPPMEPFLVLRLPKFSSRRVRVRRHISRIGRSHLDPLREVSDHRFRQFLLGRHFE